MPAYQAYPMLPDGRSSDPIEFESAGDGEAEAHVRALIGPYEAAALYEGRRIVKLMRARPRAN